MTLSFSTKWSERMGELAGQPNYFTYKILSYLHYDMYIDLSWLDNVPEPPTLEKIKMKPKLHTIREDKTNRWKAGNDIHFVINNRTKDSFQFAPVIKCVSVQTIEIIGAQTIYNCATGKEKYLIKKVIVDGKYLSLHEIQLLAYNDGFPTVRDFFNFFKVDTGNRFNHKFVGKIIHWTDKKY